MLPTPSATSSAFESWRLPVMPSAMTAERSDSIAPSIAMAKADGTRLRTRSNVSVPPCQGSIGGGGIGGMPSTTWPPTVAWKREPMVATENEGTYLCKIAVPSVSTPIASSGAGIFLMTFGSSRSSASVSAATAASESDAPCRASHSAATFSTYDSGIFGTGSANASLIWSVAITVAMPAVKPVVTGCGMNWMRRPSRANPIATRNTPAISPEISRPERPCFVTIGARMTMKAAVGPVTWYFDPPRTATIEPATMAV